MAHRHHGALDERRQALLLRDERRLRERIVGYSISDRMTAKLAVDALENAVARRGDVRWLHRPRRPRVAGWIQLVVATPLIAEVGMEGQRVG